MLINNYSENNDEVRCIILQELEKSVAKKADIKEFVGFNTRKQGENLAREGQEILFDLLENCSKPTIAAINGLSWWWVRISNVLSY